MPRTNFETMNGLRGLAAILVVVFHMPDWFTPFAPARAYLGVDLFFVLSGFVIAHSYDGRIAAGLGWREFAVIRLIRLYPLYIVGVAFSLLVIGAGFLRHGTVSDYQRTGLLFLPFALAMLPSPVPWNWELDLYPLNRAAWSLFFELLANLAYVLTWRRLTNRVLLALVLADGAWMLADPHFYGEGGWNLLALPGGLERVFWSFPLGVLLCRWHRAGWLRLPRVPPLLILAAYPPLLLLPDALVEPVNVLLALPLLVALAANSEPGPRLRPVFALLGRLSYAIYAVHTPCLEIGAALLDWLGLPATPPLTGLVFLALILPLSLLLDRLYDAPLRRWLGRMARPARVALAG